MKTSWSIERSVVDGCRVTTLLLAALVILSGCRGGPEGTNARVAGEATAVGALTVVTYNINWGSPAPQKVVAFLREARADIVFLQETHPQWEVLLRERLSDVYPESRYVTSGGAGGIAILARHPLVSARAIEAEAGWFPALRAEVETPVGRIQLLNVHLRPPLSDRGSATPSALYSSPKIHRAEMKGFLAEMDATRPIIIAGDFNEEEESGAVRDLIEAGYADALSKFDRSARTWEWPVTSSIAIKRRYDHILTRGALDCTSAQVVDVPASDHMPVVARIVPRP